MITAVVIVGAFVVGILANREAPVMLPSVKPLDTWTASDVGRFLRHLGGAYGPYADAAERNGVNGPAFRVLTAADLKQLGVESTLHQQVIISNRAKLQ